MPALRDILRRSDPQLTYQWMVVMPSFGCGPGIHLYVQDIDVPFVHIASNPYHRNNTKRYDPGFTDVEGVSITFYEDVNGTVIEYLYSWKNLVVSDDGFYGLPSVYKQDIEVHLQDQRGITSTRLCCEGVWPSQISNFSLTSSSSEALNVVCQFSCDNVTIKPSFRCNSPLDNVEDKISANYRTNVPPSHISNVPSERRVIQRSSTSITSNTGRIDSNTGRIDDFL